MECELVRERPRVTRPHEDVRVERTHLTAFLDAVALTSREKLEETRRQERCILEENRQIQERGEARRRHAAEAQTLKMKTELEERARQKKEEERQKVLTTLKNLQTARDDEVLDGMQPLETEKVILANINRTHSIKRHSQRALDQALSKMQKSLLDFHGYRSYLSESDLAEATKEELQEGAWADVVRKVKLAKEAQELYEQHCRHFNDALAHLNKVHELAVEEGSGYVDKQLQMRRLEVDIQLQSALEFLLGAKAEKEKKQKTRQQTVTEPEQHILLTALIPFLFCASLYIIILELYSVWHLFGILMMSVLYFGFLTEIETFFRFWIAKCITMAKSGIYKVKNISVFLRIVATALEDQNRDGFNNSAVVFILAAFMWFGVIIIIKLLLR